MQGKVEASTEDLALRVATRWCVKNGHRPPASVRPEILATEEILSQPLGPEVEPLPSPVEATTAMNVNGR